MPLDVKALLTKVRNPMKPKSRDIGKSKTFNLKYLPSNSFEHVIMSIQSKQARFAFAVIYRPPDCYLSCFFDEFDALLVKLNTHKDPILVCGDLYIHSQEKNYDRNVRKLCDILS